MQSDKLHDVERTVADSLMSELSTLREHAEHFAHQTMDAMVETGDAIELSEDEERLLRSYRQFCEQNTTGVFSWQKPADEGLIIPTHDMLVDPRDVSKVVVT